MPGKYHSIKQEPRIKRTELTEKIKKKFNNSKKDSNISYMDKLQKKLTINIFSQRKRYMVEEENQWEEYNGSLEKDSFDTLQKKIRNKALFHYQRCCSAEETLHGR